MINFDFAATPKLHFGEGKLSLVPPLIKQFGNNALIVTGKSSFANSFKAIAFFQDIDEIGVNYKQIKIEGEPSPNDIDYSAIRFKDWPHVVIAIGGGSVLDAGKAISAMLCEDKKIINFLEGVGTKIPSGKKIPFIAIPTTAGTGSEATKNAVITQQGKAGFKKSLRHDNYVPNYAIIDPELTQYSPPSLTAATGLDAFTQLLEAYLSKTGNTLSSTIAFEGLSMLIRNIEIAVEDGGNLSSRSAMSYAAYLSGISLANAGLGVVHGFAQPLGSLFQIPHGIVCGTLMGAANKITIEELRKKKDVSTLKKYMNVGRIKFKGSDDEVIDQLITYIDKIIKKFEIPRLSKFGVTLNDIPVIVKQTGLKNHPVQLSTHQLAKIIAERL